MKVYIDTGVFIDYLSPQAIAGASLRSTSRRGRKPQKLFEDLWCDRSAVEAIRRYRSQGMTDPAAIRITTDDFNYAYQVLSQERPA